MELTIPVNTLLFMSIHKLYVSLLIMFIKVFVIQISYHEDFYSRGINFAIFLQSRKLRNQRRAKLITNKVPSVLKFLQTRALDFPYICL